MSQLPSASVLYTRLLARARLRHLQLLVLTADHGNLRRAADEVGMSQPAATQALAELEQLIDTSLFERHARGMRITAAGQLLIPVVRQMLRALQASTESLSALQQGEGLLRIGMIPAAASAFARVVVQDFAPAHPGLRLEVREDDGEHLTQALFSGGLDLVLCRRPTSLAPALEFVPLLSDHTVVLAGLGHPLARRRRLSMQDLRQARWMQAPAGLKVRDAFDHFCAEAGRAPAIHPITSHSPSFLVEVLRDNQTLVLAPRSLGHALCSWGLARALDVTDTVALEGLGMLITSEALKQPAVQSLVQAFQGND